jgi:hypothetical protein
MEDQLIEQQISETQPATEDVTIEPETVEVAETDLPYEFKANGYTVTKGEDVDDLDESLQPYKITAEGFEKVVLGKRTAEIFAETHSLGFKEMPATFPSV